MNRNNPYRKILWLDESTGERRWIKAYERPAPKIVRPWRFSWARERQKLIDTLKPMIRHELRQSKCRRLYILGETEIGLRWHDSLCGITSQDLADTLRPQIGAQWRGIGPAFCLRDDPPAADEKYSDWYSRLLQVAGHELAHCVGCFPHWCTSFNHIRQETKFQVFKEDTEVDPDELPEYADHPKWVHHDWQFIRLALHVSGRLIEATKLRLPLVQLMAWSYFGYGDPWAYLEAVSDEIQTMKHLPLSAISKSEPPKRLLDIWASDTGHDPVTLSKPATVPTSDVRILAASLEER
ncbi:hypothetical protein [Schlesneria sp. DSM 10557]|uniref:hypothetical protein n=1 Tax=Schlesneria sp. DSM 10557 TaxID=3044399 RepID=UPI0035A1B8A6